MRSDLKTILLAIALSIPFLAACGSEGDGFNCRQACSRLEACQLALEPEDCIHDCQVIREVALDQSWEEWGTCMLEDPCEGADPESCLNQVAHSAPEREFERVLDRVCTRVVDCELGITNVSCKTLIKKYGGKRIKHAKMLKKKVLNCLGDCVVETPCSRIVDSVEPCLESCGVRFKTIAEE